MFMMLYIVNNLSDFREKILQLRFCLFFPGHILCCFACAIGFVYIFTPIIFYMGHICPFSTCFSLWIDISINFKSRASTRAA